MTSPRFNYNSNLAKGSGLVNETLALIEFYEIGESKSEFITRCISHNILNKSTEHRTKDIINLVFFDRYWKANENTVKNLKLLRESGLSLDSLKSILFVYTSRANKVLFDFVLELRKEKHSKKITKDTSRSFLLRAISDGKAPAWSDSMISRVSSYLVSCLNDFGLLDKEGFLKVTSPNTKVCSFFLHELHFKGYSDQKIVEDEIWSLLGFEFHQLIKEIERISFKGTFIFQYSGEILKIGWVFKTMEEFIDYECR
ncbi:BrxA family protein [Algoriphagus aquatilis]|uniref:BrxA family protein n=1 Tax=Algoriphagus aquatilis TaxID=490186 RepID=A0ABW0BVT5_9BACT